MLAFSEKMCYYTKAVWGFSEVGYRATLAV